MKPLLVIEVLGRMSFVGMAAIGMAVVTMLLVLLLHLLGDESRRFRSISSPVRAVLRIVLALAGSVVFALVWLSALYWIRKAVVEPLLFASLFLVTVLLLRLLYAKMKPAWIELMK